LKKTIVNRYLPHPLTALGLVWLSLLTVTDTMHALRWLDASILREWDCFMKPEEIRTLLLDLKWKHEIESAFSDSLSL
jgi:hypothetical protein